MDSTAALLTTSLEEQVTCLVCLEIFADPRELPCRHTLCFGCYTKMHFDNKGLVTCPLCRAESLSPADELPVDEKVQKVVETYRLLKRRDVDSRGGTERSDEMGKCQIPGCKEDAANVGPSCLLQLCLEHYNKDVKKLTKTCENMLDIGSGRIKTRMEWLQRQVKKLHGELEEAGAAFRELEKTLRLKREQVEVELEGHLRAFTDELELLEEQNHQLEVMENRIKDSLLIEDFVTAGETVKKLQLIHDSTDSDTMEKKAITIQEQLSELKDLVTSAFYSFTPTLTDEKVDDCKQNSSKNIKPQTESKSSDKLYKTLLDTTYKFKERHFLDSNQKMSAKSVQYMSNTRGYYHDTSQKCSYQTVRGCVVKSTESTFRPLPDEIVLVQSHRCKDYLLVYSSVGVFVSLVKMPVSIRDSNLLICDSMTQSLFCVSSHKVFGSDVYQLALDGHILCRLSISNPTDAAVYRIFGKTLESYQQGKDSILALLTDGRQGESDVALCRITENFTLVDKIVSLKNHFSFLCLVDDKIYTVSEKANSRYTLAVLSADSLAKTHELSIQILGNPDACLMGMKHIVKDMFILYFSDGKMAPFRYKPNAQVCRLQYNDFLYTGDWPMYWGVADPPNACVYFSSSYPHSAFFWMYSKLAMRLYEMCAD